MKEASSGTRQILAVPMLDVAKVHRRLGPRGQAEGRHPAYDLLAA